MLSARQRNILVPSFSPIPKLKINTARLPQDFFEKPDIKGHSQQQRSTMLNRGQGTPNFGKRNLQPLFHNPGRLTVLSTYQYEDQHLIRDVMFSSINIRKLRKLSMSYERNYQNSQRQTINVVELPRLKTRKSLML